MQRVDLAILGATEMEIAPLGVFKKSGTLRLAGRDFSLCTCRGLRFLSGTTGIGKVNAAATTAAVLSNFQAGEVWNVGCAGAYTGSRMRIGDVLVSDNCMCADEGILRVEGTAPLSEIAIPLVVKNGVAFSDSFPLEKSLERGKIRSIAPEGVYEEGGFQVLYGSSLTVGMTSGDRPTALERFRRFGAFTENMEASAIAQTCLLFDVPFLEIRGVSNIAGDRDKARWDLSAAVDHCLAIVTLLLDKLSQRPLE
ncbi:MAG: futalosine hydrolase [Syntrophobacteraceae bacterium]